MIEDSDIVGKLDGYPGAGLLSRLQAGMSLGPIVMWGYIVPDEGQERRSESAHFRQIGLLLTVENLRYWSVQLMIGPSSQFAPTVDLQIVMKASFWNILMNCQRGVLNGKI